MKYRYLFLVVLLAFFFSGCDENEPIIPPLGSRVITSPTDVPKVVLIEEFTGVRCPNCPSGTIEVEGLLSRYPDNLIAVAVHGGSFAFAYKDSEYDFKIPEGEAVLDLLGGEPSGYPSATVNRKKFNGTAYYKGKNEWGGLIGTEIQSAPEVSAEISTSYNTGTRELTINTEVTPLVSGTGPLKIGVLITESGMIDIQANDLDPDGITEDYEHKHVLRGYLTNISGDPLTDSPVVGEAVQKTFVTNLDPSWVADKCEVIIFVTGSDKAILQAAYETIAF